VLTLLAELHVVIRPVKKSCTTNPMKFFLGGDLWGPGLTLSDPQKSRLAEQKLKVIVAVVVVKSGIGDV